MFACSALLWLLLVMRFHFHPLQRKGIAFHPTLPRAFPSLLGSAPAPPQIEFAQLNTDDTGEEETARLTGGGGGADKAEEGGSGFGGGGGEAGGAGLGEVENPLIFPAEVGGLPNAYPPTHPHPEIPYTSPFASRPDFRPLLFPSPHRCLLAASSRVHRTTTQ